MSLRAERADGILTITLDRPEKRNAVTIAMWEELERLLTAVAPEDGVIILTGAGGTFSSGSDVSEFLAQDKDIRAGIEATHRVITAVVGSPVPTLARVDGLAAGSALNLALACDLVVATPAAQFSEIFVRRGLTLDSGASWLLPRLVGDRRARWMALTGEAVGAAAALDWGLISEVVEPARLAHRVAELARHLAAIPRAASRSTRRLLGASWQRTLGEALTAEAESQLAVLDDLETRSHVARFGRAQEGGSA
jgi:2-(1,2-epoxy-1,2-dihydrophenyl)acetyl-CoA isomerase